MNISSPSNRSFDHEVFTSALTRFSIIREHSSNWAKKILNDAMNETILGAIIVFRRGFILKMFFENDDDVVDLSLAGDRAHDVVDEHLERLSETAASLRRGREGRRVV